MDIDIAKKEYDIIRILEHTPLSEMEIWSHVRCATQFTLPIAVQQRETIMFNV